MDMTGEYRICAPIGTVWNALNDADVLKACIPGCQEIAWTSPTGLEAKVVQRIGPVKARFSGVIALENVEPPHSYTIRGEGKGGVAGFARGAADVRLAAEGGETVLSYEVTAQVGGKLAQLGSRLINSTAKKVANRFFGNLTEYLGQAETEGEAAEVS